MLIKQIMEVFDVLDSSTVTGKSVEEYLRSIRSLCSERSQGRKHRYG